MTQEEFLQALWPEIYVQPEVLKSHIRDIRSALRDDPKIPLLHRNPAAAWIPVHCSCD